MARCRRSDLVPGPEISSPVIAASVTALVTESIAGFLAALVTRVQGDTGADGDVFWMVDSGFEPRIGPNHLRLSEAELWDEPRRTESGPARTIEILFDPINCLHPEALETRQWIEPGSSIVG